MRFATRLAVFLMLSVSQFALAQLPKEIVNSIGMRVVLVPAGAFLMGSPQGEQDRNADEHQHRVRITKAFYLGAYEVTQAEYLHVTETNPSYFAATGDGRNSVQRQDTSQFPVENVSWEDAAEFCRKLSAAPQEQQAGRVYRLPTEAEWEYACRSGTVTPFSIGMELNGKQANCDGSASYGTEGKGPWLKRPTRVGSYAPNDFGIYDMHGNVLEWCQDWYDKKYYFNSLIDDPQGPPQSMHRVDRGGCWAFGAERCRAASRDWFTPTIQNGNLGFRVALEPVGK